MAPKIVVLGMMTKMPVAGVVWQTLHYLVGLQRLGYDVHYVESHARAPTMLMTSETDDSSALAGAFIDKALRPHGLGDKWAFVALHDDSRCLGMSRPRLDALYREAALIINLHGGTEPLEEMSRTGRLVYVESDPVQLQVELHEGYEYALDFLEPHCAFFTFGENIGAGDCVLPAPTRFRFHPTRQPVVLDFWAGRREARDTWTTVGNWAQAWREVHFGGVEYSWSKHHEWLKVLNLPKRTGASFELALSSYLDTDKELLEQRGWKVVHGLDISTDAEPYRDYVASSHGEFTVAKEQNVHFRTGWFSDRSATYLAAGRPVVTQETGFSNTLPTGHGLFGFDGLEDAAAAIEAVEADYESHCRAAAEIAREYFDADVVLRALLDHVGVELVSGRGRPRPPADPPFPDDLLLEPVSRRPTALAPETVKTVFAPPAGRFAVRVDARYPQASIVMVTYGGHLFTRLALESILANTDHPNYEIVVVDNASPDRTVEYLERMAVRHPNVHLIRNEENRGFPAATNQGLATARGEVLILLNNDVLVPPGWLSRLAKHVEDHGDCLVGPVTNRIGNEAEIPVAYRSWGEFLAFARGRETTHGGAVFPIHTLTMFCLAMPRSAYERLGGLDEQFGVGTLEDDDYSMRAREAGLPLLCAEDVFLHHFGESSFGKLVSSGRRDEILEENRRRFREKWGVEWEPYERRIDPQYHRSVLRLREAVDEHVPASATVLVVSRGDETLVDLGGRPASHFPADESGGWAGHHPADGGEAVRQLEASRERGGQYLVFPRTGLWWLDHYTELSEHLETHGRAVLRDPEVGAIFALNGHAS